MFLLVLETYRLDLVRLGEEMGEAVRRSDKAGFRRAAHALAGAAGGIGATEIQRLARKGMDEAADPAPMYPPLRTAILQACEAIDVLADGVTGGHPS
ncbi:Hpt domain-containing protein [Pseudoroseomonas globiformis]|uniref:Hpt domain-containing protein n=1 Tax=Teichococcus globiformis TaxID=2307229 RepID=A0ABV7G5L7_9PROT